MLDNLKDKLVKGIEEESHYRLFHSFLLLNTGCFFVFFTFYFAGWIGEVFLADSTNISVVISVLFLIGLIMTGLKLNQMGSFLREIQFIKEQGTKGSFFSSSVVLLAPWLENNTQNKTMVIESLKHHLFGKLIMIKWIATSLVTLGLIGTVIGFIMAFSGITPEAVGDISQVGKIVSALSNGMGVALYTTLVGAILNFWLTLNYNLLLKGATEIISEMTMVVKDNV